MTNTHTTPLARTDQLVVEQVGEESVVYDLETSVAHALAPIAAATFMYADGSRDAAELAELASLRLGHEVTAPEVEAAISQLAALSLLDGPAERSLSRRDALKAFAAVGAGALLVSSVAAPAALACSHNQDLSRACGSSTTYVPANLATTPSNLPSAATVANFGITNNSGSGAQYVYPLPSYAPLVPAKNEWALGGTTNTPGGLGWYGANTWVPTVTGGSTAGCVYLTGAGTWPTSGTGVFASGQWQCVPCDQNYDNKGTVTHYACCQIVCAPPNTGFSSWGPGTAYPLLWGASKNGSGSAGNNQGFPAKFCLNSTAICPT